MRSFVGKIKGNVSSADMPRIAADLRGMLKTEFTAKNIAVDVTPLILMNGGFLAFFINEQESAVPQCEMQKLVRSACKDHMSVVAELSEKPVVNLGEIKNFFTKYATVRPADLSNQIEIASVHFGHWAPSTFSSVNRSVQVVPVEVSAPSAHA